MIFLRFIRPAPQALQRYALFAVAIGCVLLFVREPGPEHHRLWRQFWDSGHLWLFACAGYVIAKRWLRDRRWLRYGLYVALAALVGWLIELLQLAVNRDYSLHDIAADTAGIALGLLVGGWRDLRRPLALFVAAAVAVTIYAGVVLLPIARSAVDAIAAARVFPELANFSRPLADLQRERFGRLSSTFQVVDGTLQMNLQPAEYSGFYLDDFPNDWRGHRWLHVELDNPGAPGRMTCRLHDAAHEQRGYRLDDRYNGREQLEQGANHWRIDLDRVVHAPRERQLNLGEVRVFGCFFVDLPEPRTLLLRAVWLE